MSCSYSQSTQLLTVSNGISGGLAAGSDVSVSIVGFRNPISGAEVSGFVVYTASSGGDTIDTATSSLQVSSPADFDSSSLSVHSSVDDDIAGVVQELNKMRLTFTLPVPLDDGC